ncbi:uncharacterized protein [Nicotiana tomentosiformis]|uniref:uncharacterized protein n=1 Tax=Nicotiana tomentosiformis TaxID=4098 RepID=UPI00388C6648
MAKTSKTVPQKEKASSSRSSGDKAPIEPPTYEYVPGPCTLKIDFKVENPSSVLGQCEHVSMFRVDLILCEVELQKASEERDAPRLLCIQNDEAIKVLQENLAKAREEEAELDKQVRLVLLEYGFDSIVEVNPSLSQLQQKVEKIGLLRKEVDQIKAECNQWKETIDRLIAEKETILAKLLSADVQVRNIKQKGSAQAKRIEELEARLAEAKAEVDSSKFMDDKSISMYRADAEAAQMEVREAADTADTRAHWIAELAKCRSQKETLKEIHARGFDLAEEIRKAKELEAEALSSDGDDDDDDGNKRRSENKGEPDKEEHVPEDDQEV